MSFEESDLIKARVHKYIKRTGSPGNYKYWYKDAAGNLVADESKQDMGKLDHIKRLIIAKKQGLHSATDHEIAHETGANVERVQATRRNLDRHRRVHASGRIFGRGHDYADEHLNEAIKHHTRLDQETAAPSADVPVSTSQAEAPAPRPRRARRPRALPLSDIDTNSIVIEPAHAAVPEGMSLLEEITAAAPAPAKKRKRKPAPAAPVITEEMQRDIDALLAAGIDLRPSSQEEAREAVKVAERNREADPVSANAEELRAVAPEVSEADAPIREMQDIQARGGNPYLDRAKNIFHNIQADVKEERKNITNHMLQAIKEQYDMRVLRDQETSTLRADLLARYRRISGRSRVTKLPEEDFERATFHTLDEILENKPIDVELERMKRGFAAKQFARIKPFLKASWVQANPSAPPPMPTFGDIKSWREHGGAKPAWAGTTILALPKDVFDAAYKGRDGKPKYPPRWMPIHLAPVWKYAMAKTGGHYGRDLTSTELGRDQSSKTGWKLNLGSQAAAGQSQLDNHIINSIRKYVQMRGGADQLTDIPASKLAEMNLTHSDIFKSDDLSDGAIKKLIKHKIIDPVALIPFIKAEIKVKKSFSLVVDPNAIFKSQSVKKSELIEKIKALKQKR